MIDGQDRPVVDGPDPQAQAGAQEAGPIRPSQPALSRPVEERLGYCHAAGPGQKRTRERFLFFYFSEAILNTSFDGFDLYSNLHQRVFCLERKMRTVMLLNIEFYLSKFPLQSLYCCSLI